MRPIFLLVILLSYSIGFGLEHYFHAFTRLISFDQYEARKAAVTWSGAYAELRKI